MDLTKSLHEVSEQLLKHKKVLYDCCRSDVINILVGNKSDVLERSINKEKGKKLAIKCQFQGFFEVSAEDGTNVSKVLDSILS